MGEALRERGEGAREKQTEDKNVRWGTMEKEGGDRGRVRYYKPCLISAAPHQFSLHQPALLDYKRFSVPGDVAKVTQSRERNGTQSGPARGARSVFEK